ncbi:MAG: DHA2 family efflux MFS transporter permease subunit [Alicyclobacillus sp.]|nr:DHA2 family efflux MFS transporter permease subunit [Alicyclobacillus sp.]
MSSNVQAATESAHLHKGPILGVLIFGAFAAILNQTLLNVAIPHLMTAFNVSADTVQWLSTGYMLTNGILVPITAFLIATFTTRTLFISAMTSFTIGSFICSIAPTFPVMLIGRIVQAAGAGVMMPLMMTVVLNLYPPETRGKSMGTIGIAMFFAPAVGPTLSGWMIDHWSWRLLFWVVIPLALIDIVLAFIFLRNVTERSRPSFDAWGFITSTIGFGALLYGFSEAGNKGWGAGPVRLGLIVGVIFIVLFVVRELTAARPMLNLRVFRYGMFSLSAAVSSVVNMAMFGGALLTPIYIQNVRGFTPLESGLLLLPGAIVMGIMSPVSGALLDRIGIRPLAIVGLVITTVTTYFFARLTMTTSYGHVMMLYTIRMFGMSFLAMTIMTFGLNHIPRELNSHGTAASNQVRMMAGSIGTALLVTIMTNRTNVHYAHMADWMSLLNPQFSSTINSMTGAVAQALGQTTQTAQGVVAQMVYGLTMQRATVAGINDAYFVAAGIALLALIMSLFMSGSKRKATSTHRRHALPATTGDEPTRQPARTQSTQVVVPPTTQVTIRPTPN